MNTLQFWHGGNLRDYHNFRGNKKGHYEYGPGLYLTTHKPTAERYAKGSRSLYCVTVKPGNDINNAVLAYDILKSFVSSYVIRSQRSAVIERLQVHVKGGNVKAYIFNNLLCNAFAVKPSNTRRLRDFYVNHGIDYQIVDNPFGWGEQMMVLYNTNLITQITKP